LGEESGEVVNVCADWLTGEVNKELHDKYGREDWEAK